MTLRFVPLDAGGQFSTERLGQIVGWLEEAADEVVPPLKCTRIDCVIVPGKNVVPGRDCNGFANGRWRTTIIIDPDCEGREKSPLADQLKSTLAHELHHAMRMGGPGYGRTLGEALVSEGLAQCYEEEVGCSTPNYATAVRGVKLAALAQRAQEQLWADRYEHAKWFYGSRTDESFPWSGGYSLGYVLVRRWLRDNDLSASAAVDAHARAVLSGPINTDLEEYR